MDAEVDDGQLQVQMSYAEREFLMYLLASNRPESHGIPPEKAADPEQIFGAAEFERLWRSTDEQLRSADYDLRPFTAGGLLAESRVPLARMRELGIVRTANAPAGDFAEWLVAKATGGELAPNSQKGWDVITDDGERIQVKARFVTEPIKAGQRQLSPFRSFDFDSLLVVLLNDASPVRRGSSIPRETVEAGALANEYVNAKRVIASDALMDAGEDWTARLQNVATMHLSNFVD